MIDHGSSILSIDIGSVSISMVLLDQDMVVIKSVYQYHHGRIDRVLPGLLEDFDFSTISSVVSPSDSRWLSEKVLRFDPQVSLIKAVKDYYTMPGAILLVGAGKFQLLNFDKDGKFLYTLSSTSCAAGTGSFLDQQARRLNLKGAAELSQKADMNRGDLPDIASRCSVFAKTDLIHAQQAGYSLESICDSLCKGLVINIADTVFEEGYIPSRVIFAGGVSKNNAVIRHFGDITGASFMVHEMSVFFPAIGAALLHADTESAGNNIKSAADIIRKQNDEKEYVFEPLSLKLSGYPDFNRGNNLVYSSEKVDHPGEVQIDIYKKPARSQDVFIGIDIGSTSTKAMLTDKKGNAIAGFYTYTHGQPLNATRSILDAIRYIADEHNVELKILATGTTGSGRKFIGYVIGADMIIDEITTHARAAYQLNPHADTIIEIGGQDAKFTLMKNGRVVFSKMNSVCAAGTGSFIEEQALKMNVSLKDYSGMAENAPSPLASDRCTVFMERDINYYFNQGYSRNEILAAVLHSVRDNYLKKVAVEVSIGKNICFQGATAKNKALVAAFEAKLGKQIFVSQYCHLTGALGTALILKDEFSGTSTFRGFGIIEKKIDVTTETCRLCNNNCRITVADINGEKVAYGFLCGRDYKTERFIDKNKSGFDLLKERKKIFRFRNTTIGKTKIGLPAGLNIFEDMFFWKVFFRELGFVTISSEKVNDAVSRGKRLAGAEFCAPMHAMHAHVKYLEDKADYIFMPAVLENRSSGEHSKNLYCYYTQFSPCVTSLLSKNLKEKSIVPLLRFEKGMPFIIKTLKDSLDGRGGKKISRAEVRKAWDIATESDRKKRKKLLGLFNNNFNPKKDMSIVLLGRPYMILSEKMNNNIPGIFGGLGIKSFYQDMLPLVDKENDLEGLDDLLKSMPWHFTSKIMKAASFISNTRGLYPVLVTAFKCAPDSFLIEYFQKIMDAASKPYLILQVDEHDSSVGYETRIEAAVRSFRNHYESGAGKSKELSFKVNRPMYNLRKDKIVLFPNWDQIAGRFLAANLRRHGFDTRLLDHNKLGIQKAMTTNTGQCLPLNIIAHDYIDYIKKNDLDPSRTILWMTETVLSCNIRMYPQFIKTILENHGNGMEKALVYSGEVAHTEISVDVTRIAYFAYMLSGLLRRAGCKIRPYEVNKGETDKLMGKAADALENAFEGNDSINRTLSEMIPPFSEIGINKTPKPLVAIFGDFFVRDNDVMNQGLIHTIEKYGGEALSTPYSEFYKLIAGNVMRRRSVDSGRLQIAVYRGILQAMKILERKYYKHFEPVLGKPKETSSRELEKNLPDYNIDKYHSGESFDNILKIYHIINSYPGISLFVQTNPAFCCPSLITEAMKNEIRKNTGIPIVTITYDGTTENKNDVIAPYLLG